MEKAAQQASPVPSRQSRIVIADDFEMLRRGLKSLLGTAICGEAENGQQAVERVMELRPDLVILDWTMPVINGLQAAQMIRRFAPKTKIIVFSLHDANAVREEALRAGADVFLHKTASGEEILKTIAALIGTFPERSILANAL
jgi:DNA-binding NarL/FixJ family response regulator